MEANKIKLSTVIISIAVIVIVEITTRLLITHNHLAHLTGLGLARLAEIILLLIIVKVWQQHLSTIGLASSKIYYGIKKGLVWAVAFGVAAGIVLLIIHLVGINLSGLFQMRLPSESSRLVTFLLVGALIAPIAEEIFFRGILYSFFRRWGIPTAVILSTILFILPHSSGTTLPVTQLIGGILFAVSYEIEKNLWVPIMIHSLGNLAIFTLALLI
ncbi:MAG: CPBP family intramembrane metalloprotease [Desulfobacterales bacterium]